MILYTTTFRLPDSPGKPLRSDPTSSTGHYRRIGGRYVTQDLGLHPSDLRTRSDTGTSHTVQSEKQRDPETVYTPYPSTDAPRSTNESLVGTRTPDQTVSVVGSLFPPLTLSCRLGLGGSPRVGSVVSRLTRKPRRSQPFGSARVGE